MRLRELVVEQDEPAVSQSRDVVEDVLGRRIDQGLGTGEMIEAQVVVDGREEGLDEAAADASLGFNHDGLDVEADGRGYPVDDPGEQLRLHEDQARAVAVYADDGAVRKPAYEFRVSQGSFTFLALSEVFLQSNSRFSETEVLCIDSAVEVGK